MKSKTLQLRCRSDAHVEIDAAVLELDREAARASLVGARRLPVLEIDDPVVQWARNLAAVHDSFTQRPALVRTAVLQREHLVGGGAKDRNLTAWGFHAAGAAHR